MGRWIVLSSVVLIVGLIGIGASYHEQLLIHTGLDEFTCDTVYYDIDNARGRNGKEITDTFTSAFGGAITQSFACTASMVVGRGETNHKEIGMHDGESYAFAIADYTPSSGGAGGGVGYCFASKNRELVVKATETICGSWPCSERTITQREDGIYQITIHQTNTGPTYTSNGTIAGRKEYYGWINHCLKTPQDGRYDY